jgi:hypothetical protein
MGLISAKGYEDLLGDALESLLAQKVATPEEIVAGLNERNVRGPSGQTWTVELFLGEMRRLGT